MTSRTPLPALSGNELIYSVFVRNATPEGTLAAFSRELPRIRALGTDILWLMPVQPGGHESRKGSLGSPYAIRDYRSVDPALGTLEDFKALCEAAHELGMRVMLDCVYNHCAPDHIFLEEHPDWIVRNRRGRPFHRVPDWSDVADLDYSQKELRRYLVDTLCFWAQWVDGFRCDVAPLVPLDFWQEARAAVEAVRPGAYWLAESVEPSFVKYMRDQGYDCASDGELASCFDMSYDYDIIDDRLNWFYNRSPLQNWISALQIQGARYPAGHLKMHDAENHDRPRLASLVKGPLALANYYAFLSFLKGPMLLYMGGEYALEKTPSLFERDPLLISPKALDLNLYLQKLAALKHAFPPMQSLDLKLVSETILKAERVNMAALVVSKEDIMTSGLSKQDEGVLSAWFELKKDRSSDTPELCGDFRLNDIRDTDPSPLPELRDGTWLEHIRGIRAVSRTGILRDEQGAALPLPVILEAI